VSRSCGANKKALVRKWLHPRGGMAQNTVDMLTHRNKKENLYVEKQKLVLAVLFHPVVLSAGEKMESV